MMIRKAASFRHLCSDIHKQHLHLGLTEEIGQVPIVFSSSYFFYLEEKHLDLNWSDTTTVLKFRNKTRNINIVSSINEGLDL